ncbi:hypothetical protein BG015_007130 [Linnemannia schmuckeri]|uniref:PX domain-containing protein n=1 Tax=Linnemannia schmuckeri TaxID=64567 RepID=A0A9P5S2I2_9FUNG|nr:hypothetical protein BG015_007130 [Linnemannia schmuckeri]
MTTTTKKATNGRQRGRTHSNTTSVIDPSALQYASKFSNSNNNVIIASTMAGLSNVSGPSNSAMVLPQGGLHLHSHHHNSASSNSSTTTTFYSGVKLAPPVLSASVEQLERRASDQKVWYTIQVCPCDLTIITPALASASASASTSTGAAMGTSSGGCSGGTGGAVTSIPRKPYKIYRRYEDVADFADQLEEEFAGKMVAPSATISLQHDTKNSNAASTATSASGGGFGSSRYCVNDNMPGLGSMTFTEKGMDGGASATNTNNNTSQSDSSSSTTTVTLPRLKSRLVLFVTKAVCLQRKEELDRYLQELFTLGPIIAQSRLVAEFFGIWKTDMEVHLSQEDRDPLALHSVAVMTIVFDNEKDNSMGHEHESEAENGGDAVRGEALQERPKSAGEPVAETTTMDSPSSATAASLSPPIPSSDLASALDAHLIYKTSSSSTVNPTSFPTNAQPLSTAATMKNATSTYLASPSLSPSPTAYDLRGVGWTPSLSTHLPLTTETGFDEDTKMASPTELIAPAPLPLDHARLEPATDGYESEAGTENETIDDLTTRTIKKFKSLRRAHTSCHGRQLQQQDSNAQEDSNPVPRGRSNSVSAPSRGAPVGPLSTAAQPKSKIMKRSKTIVFRPEVTMQPLSSKNVIPPWNRIPSSANNSNSNNSGVAPISPISPTTPQSATTTSASSGGFTPNTVASAQAQEPSPTSSDMDEQQQQQQPRKLTMSHSKTMSSISTTPSWSLGNNNGDHSTLAPGSLAGLLSSSMSSCNTTNNRNGSLTSARSMSISAGMIPTTLVAPWNRASGNGETNTHLHSLIKMSGQPSSSMQPSLNSPFVSVELGRSFHKKESQSQKSPSNNGAKDRTVPVLTQPPEARNRNPESTSMSFAGGSAMKGGGGRPRKPGMTHSVSAPGGFLPIMTVSAPESSAGNASETMTEDISGAPAKVAATKKRVSLHSPSLPTKQPVGILKNAQKGTRKASLTVPSAVMFPVQISTGISSIASACSTSTLSSSTSAPTTAGGGTHGAGTLATTFKIVMDADTIVALQVLEDSSFVLTMPELRSRVKAKLTKSNIQLPDKFDLLWTVPTSSMTMASPSPLTPTTGMSTVSVNQVAGALDQGVMLKTDEDLHRAIHASRNHKVTLRCIL